MTPIIALAVRDFPDPDGPHKAVTRSGRTVTLTSLISGQLPNALMLRYGVRQCLHLASTIFNCSGGQYHQSNQTDANQSA